LKILLVSLFYHPEPVSRPHDLAVMLRQQRHDVSVVTAFPSYPQGKIYPGYKKRFSQWETVDGIHILRVLHLFDRSYSAFRRVLSFLSFTFSATLHACFMVERPDVIWSCQLGLPGVLLSLIKRAPLVHEVQDLWPDWGRSSELGLKGWLFDLLDRQERMIYQRARRVVTITDGFKSVLVKKGVPPGKITVISNWANEANFHQAEYDPELANREGFDGYFNIVYMGNIGTAQGLEVVLDASKLLRSDKKIHFVLIGDGVERLALEEKARQAGLKNVRFLGSRPQEQAAQYLALADVLFLHLKHDPVYAITIPSKSFGYLAAGKPILAAAEGEIASLIERLGAGVVCPPEDSQALAEAVKKLAGCPDAERQAMGMAGARAASDEFARESLGKRYGELFAEIVREGR
jgi:colanic acid biosynthesis glycosyl transferase WcaI